MRYIPTDNVFAAHGLHHVNLDLPVLLSPGPMAVANTAFSPFVSTEWVTGSARLKCVERFPVLSTTITVPTHVRFSFCSSADQYSMARFRRQAQLLALGTIPTAPGPSNRFGRVKSVLAWWEDEYGLWFIVDEEPEEGINLVQEWSRIMQDAQTYENEDDQVFLENGIKKCAQTSDRTAERVYSAICDLLVKVLKCLQALHERDLSIISCRPTSFSIHKSPSGDIALINRFDAISPLGTFNQSHLLKDSPLAGSSLFLKEPISPDGARLNEHAARKNLRYLAPETAISKCVSSTGDIYSFGVLVYEMLTGSTIDGGPDSPEEADVDVLIDFHRHVTMKILPPLDWLQREAIIGSLHPVLPPRQLSDIVMRCLGKEQDLRYASLESLSFDLRKLGKICHARGDLEKFRVGEIDKIARFSLPKRIIGRENQLDALQKALSRITSYTNGTPNGIAHVPNKIVNISGVSGSGKSRIVRQFVQDIESPNAPYPVVTAWAKLEEAIHPPLSSFTQIFTALLDRFLADPREDVKEWNEKIRQALGPRFQSFVALIPADYWKMLGANVDTRLSEADWTALRGTFGAWAKQFIQLFATAKQPLVIVLDDIQWLPADEAKYWGFLLNGPQSLNHVLVISTCRTTQSKNDLSTSLLSPATENLHVPPLSEEGVHRLLLACFRDRLSSSTALASFIHAETGGLSLFVRTIVSTLVGDTVIFFDYDALIWRFDVVRLQRHLSKAGVDAYLERLILSLSPSAQELLFYVSCLPRRGFSIEQLRQLLQKDTREIEQLVIVCTSTATLLVRNQNDISFAHDGPKAAAYRLIPPDKAARIHSEISQFLRRPEFHETYVYDAADHALQAKELGVQEADNEEYVRILLRGATRAAMAASFTEATRFLDAIEDTIESSGGLSTWLQAHRELYLRYIEFYAQIACIIHTFEEAFEKLDKVYELIDNLRERIIIDSMRARLYTAAGRMQDAANLIFDILEANGYQPNSPIDQNLLPSTPEEVEAFDAEIKDEPIDPNDTRFLMMCLMASAGSSIYFCEPNKRQHIFDLGLTFALGVKRVHVTTAYYVLTHALAIGMDRLELKRAYVTLGKRVMQQSPTTYLTGHALVGVAAQTYFWLPWDKLDEDYIMAVENTLNVANYEHSANALMFFMLSKIISGRPLDLDVIVRWFNSMREFVPASSKYLINLSFQFQERINKCQSDQSWELEGSIASKADTEANQALDLHSAVRNVLALRLATFYDAPLEELEAMIVKGEKSMIGGASLIYGTEWSFLKGLVAIRSRKHPEHANAVIEEFSLNTMSPDFKDRLLFLQAVQNLQENVKDALERAEKVVDTLIEHNQQALAGLLSFYLGQSILRVTNSQRLASGFLRAAAGCYRNAEMIGLCEMLRKRWPSACPSPPATPLLPSQALGILPSLAPPPLRRASLSNSAETAISHPSSGTTQERLTDPKRGSNDQLDALALMRSSLALASEQDPPVLLCTLLRILCQFLRAEYAAIALCDDADNYHVRLRAAGPFSRIVPYDLRITDEATRQVCPTSLILHTARTGKAVTSVSATNRFRADAFFAEGLPRSLICLPVLMQGEQKGAIVLTSMTIATAQGQWEAAREVIATLATFACIVTSNVSFTKRLKNEVDQRTAELTNALAAKTQFLSQCSHELRSPLSAVLGLAAVLEASSGLSDVQREHLRTITSSGEDLLGLINNILDHSRLESGSVTLESIPFNLRDVCEGALDSVAAVAQKKGLELALLNPADTDPPGMIGDPFRIKQILLNLLSNAVKFTHTGRVTVKWKWQIVEENKVRVEMDVEDTGIGIPASKMDKLFRSFSQIDESITRSFGGSGLGLIISKDLAKLLGGDCNATSEYEKGSKFTFSLVSEPDPNHSRHICSLEKARDCFIICDPGPWWDMLERNLQLLNIAPVRFAEDVMECLVKGHPDGLNDKKQFAYIMVNTQMVNPDIMKRMRELQHKAKILYLVRSIDLAKTIRDLNITREAIISRPIKFSSLQRALLAEEQGTSPAGANVDKNDKPNNKKVNRKLSKTHPLTILLVDDNAVNVTVGRRILELFGYKSIVSASDGQQAIDAAEKVKYDLILLDLQMPVLDGFSAQERIRASPLAGDPCVVALTANADQATQQLCADAGFFNYLSKPLDIPRLEKILGEVFEYRKEHGLNIVNSDRSVDQE